MTTWLTYTNTVREHSVVGDLRVCPEFYSPQLDNRRQLFVWLPESYHKQSNKHYPVLYMHDGQNLFDRFSSYAGEWAVDETMQALAKEGYEAIIVGIPNNQDRLFEYNPYPAPQNRKWDGRGDTYLKFLVETVKPCIDADFRTLKNPEMNGIAGSSMGGLISLYGFLQYPQTFGFCGSFSPAYWYGKLHHTISEKGTGRGKVYLDIGTREGYIFKGMKHPFKPEGKNGDSMYVKGVRQLHENLLQKGYRTGENLMYVEEKDAEHNESAWARRLPDALRFILPKV